MRSLSEFSLRDWLRLIPLGQGWRQIRNDLLLANYRRDRPPELRDFLARIQHLRGTDIAVVIAFEQPWALDWQLSLVHRNLPGTTVLVFDNSRSPEAREQIAQVCMTRDVAYLGLPEYKTRHVNRSHGMAMSWVYTNVVCPLQPRRFGYLDHDLIPVRSVDIGSTLAQQPVFGLINQGDASQGSWNLWAGYCFFAFAYTEGKVVNFLYDFSRDLDTGGRNWPTLYRPLPVNGLRFATRTFADLRVPGTDMTHPVEIVDGRWIHIGGISYNDNFEKKRAFFEALRRALEHGARVDEAMEAA